MADPYEKFRDKHTPDEPAFAKLAELIQEQQDAELAVVEAESALKRAQQRLRQVSEYDLPQHMEALSLGEFTTHEGLRVTVQKKIRASIGDRKAEAYKWLIENDQDALIKRTVVVALNRDEGEKAKLLLENLRGQFPNVAESMKVEPATLLAFVKRRLEKGEELPLETFGVHEQKFTKIQLPK